VGAGFESRRPKELQNKLTANKLSQNQAGGKPELCNAKRTCESSVLEFVQSDGTFNPWRKVCGFYPADVVARQRDLTDGQKRLYERAARWAGKNGCFWYSFATIADALGKSVRQVKDDMAVLEEKGLLKHVRRCRQSNIYSFLWHPMFEVQPTALQQGTLEVQDAPLKVQDDAVLKVQPTAQEFSPLLNCVPNCGKSAKLTTDDESQKPTIPASDSRFGNAGFAEQSRKPKAELAAGSGGRQTAAATSANSPEKAEDVARAYARIRINAAAIMEQHPPREFEENCMQRTYGHATADAVADFFERLWRVYRAGEKGGPNSWNWFYAAIGNEFNPAECGRSPEPVAAPRRVTQAEINRSTAAIEIPDAPDSLVMSYQCKCGAEIREYTSHVEGACTCPKRQNVKRAEFSDYVRRGMGIRSTGVG
jgi:hypothetical protein